MRPRGFSQWNPRPATLAVIDAVRIVLDEYEYHLPLTLRQIFYRLVVANALEKTEKAYGRLCEHMNRARRAGMISFSAIRDDGFLFSEPFGYDSAEDFRETVTELAKRFTLHRLAPQEMHLTVWCEAQGMVPQLERVAHRYGVSVASSGGFDSVTAKHAAAQRLMNTGKPCIVLHIGDHDPSGVHIGSSLAEDLKAFGGKSVHLTRLAVTPEQVDRYDLPTAPPKQSDNRQFSGHTTQAEALPPDVLAEILRDAIESRLDMTLFQTTLNAEEAIRAELVEDIA